MLAPQTSGLGACFEPQTSTGQKQNYRLPLHLSFVSRRQTCRVGYGVVRSQTVHPDTVQRGDLQLARLIAYATSIPDDHAGQKGPNGVGATSKQAS